MNQQNMEIDAARLMRSIQDHEGYVGHPYQDSRGLWTAGWGHLLVGVTSLEQHKEWLTSDILSAYEIAERYGRDVWQSLKPEQREVLIEMAFQLGNRLWEFQRMRAAMGVRDDLGVAREMRDSVWFDQTPQRVEDLIKKWQG